MNKRNKLDVCDEKHITILLLEMSLHFVMRRIKQLDFIHREDQHAAPAMTAVFVFVDRHSITS